jgi:hypothetical protein
MGLKIYAFICQLKLFTNIEAVKIDCAGGNAHKIGNIFGGSALADQVGDPSFRGRQMSGIHDEAPAKG